MILGLTGKNAAGKGEVANYLKSKGFVCYSLSDVIRDEATKRNLDHSRENLIKLGNELREKFGPNYIAQQINLKIRNNKNQNFVIDSIRSPFEVNELRKNKNFILVGIDAPIEIRFKRLVERDRIGDAKTLEAFKEQEQKENLKSATGQQLDATFAMTDKVINNDNTLQNLHNKIDNLLEKVNQIQ